MSIFEIDSDIRKARTISTEFYTVPKYFELSKEKIFSRSWQFLCRDDEVEGLKPTVILPGIIDEPVVLIKTSEWISCVSNVCTHRGKVLIDEPCHADLIRCRYHGRRFLLDGKMISMPEFEGVENFPAESDILTTLALAEMNGFLFSSVDPVAAWNDFAGDAIDRLGAIDTKEIVFEGKCEYEIEAHWALYCENYLEGFHIPYVHHDLNAIVDYGSYTTELFRYSSLQTGLDETGEIAARYLFIFPNLMFNFYPWGISVNLVRPVSPSKTVVEFLTYVSDKSLLKKGAGADLHTVELEDEAVVESVQKGIRSRFYTHGRYSPRREQGTHHFHRLIAEFMR